VQHRNKTITSIWQRHLTTGTGIRYIGKQHWDYHCLRYCNAILLLLDFNDTFSVKRRDKECFVFGTAI